MDEGSPLVKIFRFRCGAGLYHATRRGRSFSRRGGGFFRARACRGPRGRDNFGRVRQAATVRRERWSILLDQFGLVGFAARPATPLRLFGALLLVAGVLLIRKF
ncbi:MAG TPA: DMT family transporter [Pyrinomonadaceae bacterium]|nr:DMT family transporter [Pyrinomonadaceae bacterium]